MPLELFRQIIAQGRTALGIELDSTRIKAVLIGPDHAYVHWKLTGRKVLGVGDASGVFPIDSETNNYHAGMMEQFNRLLGDRKFEWRLKDILPQVLVAGEAAGTLTDQGAKMLDPLGVLRPGIPLCPPEGDAGTGMVATNSIAPRTGNVSAGTSVFTMVVLERPLSKVYPEIDMVTTPAGKPVAMVHCNSCTSDIDAWISLFGKAMKTLGAKIDRPELFDRLLGCALQGDADCGGLLSYNYYSGEPITGLDEGRPLFVRMPDAKFTLANFMRTHLYSALSTLKLGMDLLFEQEKVTLDKLLGHGGFFKTRDVGLRMMAAAVGVPLPRGAHSSRSWRALFGASAQRKVLQNSSYEK